MSQAVAIQEIQWSKIIIHIYGNNGDILCNFSSHIISHYKHYFTMALYKSGDTSIWRLNMWNSTIPYTCFTFINNILYHTMHIIYYHIVVFLSIVLVSW